MEDTVSIDMDENIESVSATYSLSFLRKLKKALKIFEENDTFFVSLNEGHPIKIKAEFEHIGMDLILFLAPRMEEETEWEEDDLDEF
jgi:hypothetical protein